MRRWSHTNSPAIRVLSRSAAKRLGDARRIRRRPLPAQYESMRDHFIREGMKSKAAKTKAAKIYNSTHKTDPVTNRPDNRDNRDNRSNLKDGY